MIKTKNELREYLRIDKDNYVISSKHELSLMLSCGQDYYLWRYFNALRRQEYHVNCGHRIRALYWGRRKNQYGIRMGLFIHPNCLGKGVRIWHTGDIIIHKDARIGDYCQLHGMNCIGNKGTMNSGVPIIGNNVNIGVGAKIIGDIRVADSVTIAANAVVINSCANTGATLVGVPAHEVGRTGYDRRNDNANI